MPRRKASESEDTGTDGVVTTPRRLRKKTHVDLIVVDYVVLGKQMRKPSETPLRVPVEEARIALANPKPRVKFPGDPDPDWYVAKVAVKAAKAAGIHIV